MTGIDLNDLPRWSPWPSRLLGLTPWEPPCRTVEKVEQEYDHEKYADCLAYYDESGGQANAEQIKCFELGQDLMLEICMCEGNNLVRSTVGEAQARYDSMLKDEMCDEIERCASVVELGCGYGYNLWALSRHFQDKNFVGGDYSKKAVRLARSLYGAEAQIRVEQFDFYADAYEILNEVPKPIALFTAHALEQLPQAGPFLEGLLRRREGLGAVFHFEPVYELYEDDLLGLLRRRYVEMNDYNRDLLTELRDHLDLVEIVHLQRNLWGWNPLNSTSVIQWRLASS